MSDREPPIVLTLCETERMAMLEAALQFVINRADGLHYTFYATPITNDPKIDAARRLLPGVKWAWVEPR